jgi:hypothetical protein
MKTVAPGNRWRLCWAGRALGAVDMKTLIEPPNVPCLPPSLDRLPNRGHPDVGRFGCHGVASHCMRTMSTRPLPRSRIEDPTALGSALSRFTTPGESLKTPQLDDTFLVGYANVSDS